MPVKSRQELMAEARRRVSEIDAAPLAERLNAPPDERPILIDVREPDEWASGRIPGAIHIPLADVERDVARRAFGGQITEDELRRPVVLYCAHGFRSLLAGDVLKRMGFENVVSLRGGLEAWQQRGGVVERL